jgi:hypothetical protein
MLAEDVHLFDVEPRTQYIYGGMGNYQLLGDSHLLRPNEPNAVAVNYYLKAKAAGPVKVTVADPYGQVLADLTGKGEAGLNAVLWFMRVQRPGQQRGGFGGFYGGRLADPGEYVVTLDVAGTKLTKKAVIRGRQGWTVGPVTSVIK